LGAQKFLADRITGQWLMVLWLVRIVHRIESFLVLLRMANTDPAGMSNSAAILRPDNPF
jgi:hypothetical protein